MNDNNINLEPINQELSSVWPSWTAVKILGKGASGAAIQNMNLALGLDETAGLEI